MFEATRTKQRFQRFFI